jgi:YHS domain-containing protein
MNTRKLVTAMFAVSVAVVFFLAGAPVKSPGFGPVAAFAEPAEKPQANCPVMGGAVDKSVYTDYKGKRVYFCCPGCKGPFMKDPDNYIKKMEADGVVLEKAS